MLCLGVMNEYLNEAMDGSDRQMLLTMTKVIIRAKASSQV